MEDFGEEVLEVQEAKQWKCFQCGFLIPEGPYDFCSKTPCRVPLCSNSCLCAHFREQHGIIRYESSGDAPRGDMQWIAHDLVMINIECNLGLLDTGASVAMMSISNLVSFYMDFLRPRGLAFKLMPDKQKALGGVGGRAQVIFHVLLPIGLGGMPGTLETAVTANSLPTLVPNALVRALKGLIDQEEEQVTWRVAKDEKGEPLVSKLITLFPSEHIAVDITEGLEHFMDEYPEAASFKNDEEKEMWLKSQVQAALDEKMKASNGNMINTMEEVPTAECIFSRPSKEDKHSSAVEVYMEVPGIMKEPNQRNRVSIFCKPEACADTRETLSMHERGLTCWKSSSSGQERGLSSCSSGTANNVEMKNEGGSERSSGIQDSCGRAKSGNCSVGGISNPCDSSNCFNPKRVEFRKQVRFSNSTVVEDKVQTQEMLLNNVDNTENHGDSAEEMNAESLTQDQASDQRKEQRLRHGDLQEKSGYGVEAGADAQTSSCAEQCKCLGLGSSRCLDERPRGQLEAAATQGPALGVAGDAREDHRGVGQSVQGEERSSLPLRPPSQGLEIDGNAGRDHGALSTLKEHGEGHSLSTRGLRTRPALLEVERRKDQVVDMHQLWNPLAAIPR